LVLTWACDGAGGQASAADPSNPAQLTTPECLQRQPDRRGRFLDVNGDGFADLAVGAPSAQSTFVYLGGPSGIGSTPAATLVGDVEAGAAVAAAGDVNHDGFGDLIVGSGMDTATVYLGSASGVNAAGIALDPGETLRFGATVSTAGDVNGDGFDDVIVGTRYGALIYLGNAGGVATSAAHLLAGPGSAALTVVGGVDFNRDGFGDVVVGSGNVGVNIFMGGPAGPSTAPSLTLAGTGGAAAAGDVNGDHYSDLLVATGSGVDVYAGSRRGLSATPLVTLKDPTGAGFGDAIGTTLSSAGDVNGDRFDDLVIGSLNGDRAYVFLGGRRGPGVTPARTLTGAVNSGFGAAVGGAGDTNGDGFSDVIVGARTAGQAFVFLGATAGPSATPAVTLTGPARFGESVSRFAR
jgi:hypothetical protein